MAPLELLPESEREQYGDTTLITREQRVLDFWHKHMVPLFTAKHGSDQITAVIHAGGLSPVADRQHIQDAFKISHTGSEVWQQFLYFVMGIGEDYPIPDFLGEACHVVKFALGRL